MLISDLVTDKSPRADQHLAWQETEKKMSALIVVDVQNDFLTGSLALKECPAKEVTKPTSLLYCLLKSYLTLLILPLL